MIADSSPSSSQRETKAGDTSAILEHPAIERSEDLQRLSRADLSDQQRIGVLLQGAALLAHLEHAGLRLSDGWRRCGVDNQRSLRGVRVEAGVDRVPLQTRLRQLLLLLFDAQRHIAGRGQARRIGRLLHDQWDQELEPDKADEEVARILDEAPFLWRRKHAPYRRALVALHRCGGRVTPWVAGPRVWRRALLAQAGRTYQALADYLEGSDALNVWQSAGGAEPEELIRRGRWSEALRRFDGRQPSAKERGPYVDCLLAAGRYEQALKLVARPRSLEDRVRKIECQYQLRRVEAARRALTRMESEALPPELELSLADVAFRVHGRFENRDALETWVARCRQLARGRRAPRAHVCAAFGCWDLQDRVAMARHLEAGKSAIEDERLAWRYHQAQMLYELRWGTLRAALRSAERAASLGRRCRTRVEEGRLWNDVCVVRHYNDDLEGAERACRYALRMLRGCEGPIATTLGYSNLAEIRIRRGRLKRARMLLQRRSRTESRRDDNPRGAAQDADLYGRLALAEGRFHDALGIAEEALRQLELEGASWWREELLLLCARAHGMLGHERRASQCLEGLETHHLVGVEPEERPLLYAHAHQPETARRLARQMANAVGRLIEAVLEDRPLSAAEWEAALERLEPYRAARLVFDLHLVRADAIPDSWRRRAGVVLQRCGAPALAERLKGGEDTLWTAIAEGLARPGPDAVARLLAAAGHRDAVLSVREGPLGDERIVAVGEGGPFRAELVRAQKTWRLDAARSDERLEALAGLCGVVSEVEGPAPRPSSGSRTRPSGSLPPSGMIGESPILQRAVERLQRLGRGELPILILGETGTGKELAAKYLHRVSARSTKPFLAVNCAAMSETLVLSDLFGHVRGAFTGADKDHAGVFESAKGGSVFLDEIGDLPPAAQGMMLRVLQEGEIRRLGESHPRQVDVRIVAATHRSLERMVKEGAFRADLYYRLGVGNVHMPALRERGRDCLLLAEHFLESLGGGSLSDDAARQIVSFHWPGNVRQLRGVLAGAVALAGEGGLIEPSHLELPEVEPIAPYHEWLEHLKRERIRAELERCGGNQSEAARQLGLSRQALSYLVKQLGLS